VVRPRFSLGGGLTWSLYVNSPFGHRPAVWDDESKSFVEMVQPMFYDDPEVIREDLLKWKETWGLPSGVKPTMPCPLISLSGVDIRYGVRLMESGQLRIPESEVPDDAEIEGASAEQVVKLHSLMAWLAEQVSVA